VTDFNILVFKILRFVRLRQKTVDGIDNKMVVLGSLFGDFRSKHRKEFYRSRAFELFDFIASASSALGSFFNWGLSIRKLIKAWCLLELSLRHKLVRRLFASFADVFRKYWHITCVKKKWNLKLNSKLQGAKETKCRNMLHTSSFLVIVYRFRLPRVTVKQHCPNFTTTLISPLTGVTSSVLLSWTLYFWCD